MTTIISTNQVSTLLANTANETFVLLEGIRLVPATGSAISATAATGRNFIIDGDIFASAADAIAIAGANGGSVNTIHIGQTGTVHGANGTAIDGSVGLLDIFNDGLIEGQGAIETSALKTQLANTGTIRSTFSAAILASNNLTLDNRGDIVAQNADALTLTAGDHRIFNSGLISSQSDEHFAIAVSPGSTGFSIFENTGTIIGHGLGFQGSNGTEDFFNTGLVVGNMDFGDGTDFYNSAGGRLRGSLEMGDGEDFITLTNGASVSSTISGDGGSDEYVIDSDAYNLTEDEFGGVDVVKTSVSFILGDNFETLELTGAADLVGRGNAIGDNIFGNDGDNSLFGRGGNDLLEGNDGADFLSGGGGSDFLNYAKSSAGVTVNLATGKASGGDADGDRFVSIENLAGSNFADRLTGSNGNNQLIGDEGKDVLAGGKGVDQYFGDGGADTFVFATGDGKDLVSDFSKADGDRINLSGFDAIASFADLKANHMEQDGGAVVITSGKDELTLDSIAINDLVKSDFIF